MLSSVLRSERAVSVNIAIMRTFVRLRGIVFMQKELSNKLDALEIKYDSQFIIVFDAIRKLMQPSSSSQGKIGFKKTKKKEE